MIEHDNISTKPSEIIRPTTINEQELSLDKALRPLSLSEYIGQAKLKSQLEVFIQAANRRQEAIDHVLLFGPPGLGKTTLAHIIAREMGANLKITSGPVLEKAGDLAAMLTNLQDKDILFIDEIHRLHASVEEILYSAMEDYNIDIMIGDGPAARSIKIDLPQFTLIGATTRSGMLTNPLRDRFGIVARLEFYTPAELSLIIMRSAKLLNIDIDEDAAFNLALRSRGTPRIANRLIRRVRDVADFYQHNTIRLDTIELALDLLGIDKNGLDSLDNHLLNILVHRFSGGPVGLENLAAAIGESAETIEEIIEPYLIQHGFIQRTAKGRMALDKSYQHMGVDNL